MKKSTIAVMLTAAMAAASLAGCGGGSDAPATQAAATTAAEAGAAKEEQAEDAADAPEQAADGELIKVGIINNDPNESGYRTANDADLKKMFCEENGYEASFAYSLKNDEQINAAQKFNQDELD